MNSHERTSPSRPPNDWPRYVRPSEANSPSKPASSSSASPLFATAITLVIVWGFVLSRRKDLGRRRALGATRATIIALVVGQVALTAALASAIGALLCTATLALLNTPTPPASLPAIFAANRDPLHELRVP